MGGFDPPTCGLEVHCAVQTALHAHKNSTGRLSRALGVSYNTQGLTLSDQFQGCATYALVLLSVFPEERYSLQLYKYCGPDGRI